MLLMLLATPNHTKPKENTKLNSFLQDLTKTSKRCEFNCSPQNVRSERRSGFKDYVIDVGSKIGRLDFKISQFLSEKPWRNSEDNRRKKEETGVLPLLNGIPFGRASQIVRTRAILYRQSGLA
jgi:hypothetical protein